MPSFSKLLILSTLLLSGVLSLPTALPDGVRGKREADPKADNSFHFGGDFDGGLTRGGSYKREASASASPEPEAHNTLEHVAISTETEKRDNSFHFGGDFGGGLTEDKRDSSVE